VLSLLDRFLADEPGCFRAPSVACLAWPAAGFRVDDGFSRVFECARRHYDKSREFACAPILTLPQYPGRRRPCFDDDIGVLRPRGRQRIRVQFPPSPGGTCTRSAERNREAIPVQWAAPRALGRIGSQWSDVVRRAFGVAVPFAVVDVRFSLGRTMLNRSLYALSRVATCGRLVHPCPAGSFAPPSLGAFPSRPGRVVSALSGGSARTAFVARCAAGCRAERAGRARSGRCRLLVVGHL